MNQRELRYVAALHADLDDVLTRHLRELDDDVRASVVRLCRTMQSLRSRRRRSGPGAGPVHGQDVPGLPVRRPADCRYQMQVLRQCLPADHVSR
ncbi:hypothetical protein PA7_48820 [Pseudonocardia asaccharolytica DSM 44247 = NBRC 16224]|uniref:Uncharacterized protein n=1 Tax=Pseudonocardia asaccharolytica DSM 44247 = NBRC 16224 TaxID=1123024 RepID=A0A511D8C0_9PSEU|nr:hypothetical protein PA7_48820 [Pseudonocardia asaccharolytica DSM 44247 = NBRC 16224]